MKLPPSLRLAGLSVKDALYDAALAPRLRAFRASAAYRAVPRLRILVVGVQSPRRPDSLGRIFAAMRSDRHEIVTAAKDVGGLGKLANTNVLVDRPDRDDFDYIVATDDDVALPAHFIDDLFAVIHLARLEIAAPAHRWRSYHNHKVTRRVAGALARTTNFVEVGPLAVFSRVTYDTIFPLPELVFGWGLDFLWPKLADAHGWRIGIVDAVPLTHLAPAGVSYDLAGAYREFDAFRAQHGIDAMPEDMRTRAIIRDLAGR